MSQSASSSTIHHYIRPGYFASRVVNPLAMRFGATTLVVRGRRSGKLQTVPVRPIEFEGARYLVSNNGTSEWVRNLRAAREGELRNRGRVQRFRALEIKGAERAAVVAANAKRASGPVKAFYEKYPDPDAHPTFRIQPVA